MRFISDAEARKVIDDWNKEHPDAPVQYDYKRESGREFNADTMQLEEPSDDAGRNGEQVRLSLPGEEGKGDEKRDTSKLSAVELTEDELGIEQKRLSNVIEKPARIEKLRTSDYASIDGTEIDLSGTDKEKKRSALEFGKTLQGSYRNADTGNVIQLQRGRKNGGIKEVLQHNYKDMPHLQSIAAIPQIIEKSIYIDSEENTDKNTNPDVTEVQHYVCGLKIGNEDYTVHALIFVDNKGNKYYDHNLVQIEKGKLLDHVSGQAVIKGFGTTPGTKPTTNSERKVNNLISILQTNPEEISSASERLQEIKSEIEKRNNKGNKVSLSIAADDNGNAYDNGDMPFDEMISKGLADLAQKNKDNVELRVRAMRGIGGNLAKLRQAMSLQRTYDRSTVDSIVRMANMMMGSGIYSGFTPYEVRRLMGMVNRAAGREDITKEADKVVDLMLNHQLKELDGMFKKQLRTKATKLDNNGVEVQAGLDIAGQRSCIGVEIVVSLQLSLIVILNTIIL